MPLQCLRRRIVRPPKSSFCGLPTCGGRANHLFAGFEPANLLHWFNLRPRHCLFYFRNPTFSILGLGPATFQATRPHPKSTHTRNQQGVTRWIHIAHKGLIRDCCQSQQSFSIPTLILNAITPSISHILQSQPSGCFHLSTACRWPAKPRHTAHWRTTIAAQICPQHTQTNMFRTSTSLRALCTVEWNVCVVVSQLRDSTPYFFLICLSVLLKCFLFDILFSNVPNDSFFGMMSTGCQ